jgi:ABC-2 type transport system ATP-binding protein
MIEIEGLVRCFGAFSAVDGLSLEVAGGEILGLVGPNGAGKTTTLRCLCGVIPPTAGVIRIGGRDLQNEPIEARRRMAFVPDEPHLFDNLTVDDHLAVVARIYGVDDWRERSSDLLDRLELAQRRTAFPAELSRGMKQKLMLATALLHRPQALVLDEPLTGLDPGAMRRTKRIILDTAAGGCSIIVSSHLLHLVGEICHRVLILNRGRAVLDGTIAEIRSALPDLDQKADLEEIFFRATEPDEDQ